MILEIMCIVFCCEPVLTKAQCDRLKKRNGPCLNVELYVAWTNWIFIHCFCFWT